MEPISNNTNYLWPQAHQLYPDRGKKSYRMKRLRYRLRSMLHFNYIRQFEDFVSKSSDLVELLNLNPSFAYPLVHRFLDKRFAVKRRFELMQQNLKFVQKLTALHHPKMGQSAISFGEVIDGFEMVLKINEHQAMEGFLALELYETAQDRLIYLATFAQVDDAILVAVIQGPNDEDSKEIVKLLTKKCHGLRPASLMVYAMKLLTKTLGFKQLKGIPQKYQNKSRIVQSKRYTVDYDAIFGENGGELKDYWQLPLEIESKSLDQIESKKRSMYRKRYAMLENLLINMQQKLA